MALANFGLPEEKMSKLNVIIDNERTTLAAKFAALDPIFDVLGILSAQRNYDLKLRTGDVSSYLTQALSKGKSSSDLILDSIPLILGDSCPADEADQNATYPDYENIVTQISSAISLAASGNCTDIRTEFDVFFVSAKGSLENVIRKTFDAVRACANSTNAETLAAIKIHENESTDAVRRTNNAVFDAIKVNVAGISTEKHGAPVIPEMKVYRERAALGAKDVVEHTFGVIRGLFVSAELNRPDIAASMISDQYAQTASSFILKRGSELTLAVIEGYLNKVKLGLSDDSHGDSAAIDAAQAETVAYYKAGFQILADSISSGDPIASTASETAKKLMDALAECISIGHYNGIRAARGEVPTYPESLKKIQEIDAALCAKYPNFVRSIFALIQPESGTDTGLRNRYDDGLAEAFFRSQDVFEGIRVMAKACHGIEAVNEDDFNKIQEVKDGVRSAIDDFCSHLFSRRVAVVALTPNAT